MIVVEQIVREQTKSQIRLRARIKCDGSSLDAADLWFSYPLKYRKYLSQTDNIFVAALLFPAMHIGSTLKIKGTISKKLYESLKEFMEIIHQWWPQFTTVAIEADDITEVSCEGKSVGLFFSGGVDSFYSLLKNENSNYKVEDKISHLIFAKGLDIDLNDDELFNKAVEGVDATANKLGKHVVEVSTNARKVLTGFGTWNMQFGAVLMSIAFGLEGLLKKVYIAAPHTYTDLEAYEGSHPLLDRLWSTESLEVVHDGCEATRIEKVKQLAKSEVALKHLRVCWENRDGKVNCGVCEKCIRTMISLKIVGALDHCSVFSEKLDYKKIVELPLRNMHAKLFMKENLDAAVAMQCNPKLIWAFKECLNPGFCQRFKKMFWSGTKKVARPIDRVLLGGRLRNWYKLKKNLSFSKTV